MGDRRRIVLKMSGEVLASSASDETIDASMVEHIAAHIAFARPLYITRDAVPEADVAAERATVEKIALNEGKPEASLPKVVEGRLNGWYKERVLVDQPFIKDEKQTIAKLLGDATVTEFAQVVVGD